MVLRSSAVWIFRCADYGLRADLSRMYILEYIKALNLFVSNCMPLCDSNKFGALLEKKTDLILCTHVNMRLLFCILHKKFECSSELEDVPVGDSWESGRYCAARFLNIDHHVLDS